MVCLQQAITAGLDSGLARGLNMEDIKHKARIKVLHKSMNVELHID